MGCLPALLHSLMLSRANNFGSHKYQQLPLIPVEEFLALFPDAAAKDDNQLMHARIEHERGEREKLESHRQDLLKRKQKLIAENTRRKEDLANLDQNLEKFIDVRWPLSLLIYSILTYYVGRQAHLGALRKGSLRK